MKILFLSQKNCCRSQIAESILRSLDKSLEIYSAGIDPAPEINPVAIEVMKEAGITIAQKKPVSYQEVAGMGFDFLITVGDNTMDNLKLPFIEYKRKMHLGFHNPFGGSQDLSVITETCREIRDEIFVEMEYFYNRILKPSLKTS